MSTTLTVVEGRLALQGEKLFYQVASDDHGFIDWPEFNPFHLFGALYDQGNIDDDAPWGNILLPDGTTFGELVPCGFNPAPAWEPKITELSKEHERVRKAAQEPY
jgi:hypothetical protein